MELLKKKKLKRYIAHAQCIVIDSDALCMREEFRKLILFFSFL